MTEPPTDPPPQMPPPAGPYAPPTPYAPVPGQPYYHPTYGWVTPPSSTNGMAIASLVLSILWLGGLGSILGIIFGHVSRSQIRKRPEKGKNLSLAGLIVGYVGLVGAIALWTAVAVVWNNSGVRNSIVRDDMRDVASAEFSYADSFQTFTNDANALGDHGFEPFPFPDETIEVAYSGNKGFCIVGSRNGSDDWYLYDSKSNDFPDYRYQTASDAEHACTAPATSGYSIVT